jgi:hypothetical protein
LNYVEEVDLNLSNKLKDRFNRVRPSWAKIGTFVSCGDWWFSNCNDDDNLQQPSLEDLKEPSKIYRGSFSYLKSEHLIGKFWVVYKPDFSISTWFNDKPEELSQSAMVLVSPIEKIFEDAEDDLSSIKASYFNFYVDRVIPFNEIANYFEPSYSQVPLSAFQGVIENKKDPYWQKYYQIVDRDLVLIEAHAQGDVSAWFVCQKRDNCDAPVVILYSSNFITELFTFFGNCPLTCKQWETIERYCQ